MSSEQAYLLITKGPRIDEKILFSGALLTIGRSDAADLSIKMDSLSRTHCRIVLIGSEYILEDLGSTNGTFINGQQIEQPTPLTDDDLIGLGSDVEIKIVLPKVVKSAAGVTDKPLSGGETVVFADYHAPSGSTIELPDNPPPSGATVLIDSQSVSGGATIMMSNLPPIQTSPPRLVVTASGQEPKVYTLTAPRLRIGRMPDNDIVIDNAYVSRYHAELEMRGQEYFLHPSSKVMNTLLLDGQPVMAPMPLKHGSKIRVGGFGPRDTVTLSYLSFEGEDTDRQVIKFAEKQKMTIGRDQGNDIVLPAPTISRYHAEVEKIGQRYRVRDLRSSNGTFVNGKRVETEIWVHPGDAIQLGPYRFAVAENEFSKFDASENGVEVKVLGVNKWVNKKLNLLQDISLVFKPKEFIVVVGQSGGGKSTLVDAIAGYRPATHGRILVNDTIDVYREFDAIRSNIGYVPQKDIIHMELTVFQALDYAAKMRMPVDTTTEERHKRVDEVMEDLDLGHRKDTQISKLSGGQQKRVSIGVELLTKPNLFFLDEPTSGLDPGMETELMRLMRRLADQGRTIIMITHATKNVMLADKVVFLARGGYLTWFGPPDEALTYFNTYRSERDQRSSPMEFDHIYTILDQEALGSGKQWAERYRADPAYQKYIAGELADHTQPAREESRSSASKSVSKRNQVSVIGQFLILSSRYIRIISQDRFNLVLLLLTAPLMASLDFVVASSVGRDTLGFNQGNLNNLIISLTVMINTSILVGGLAFMRELVKEREIYKRERMVNMRLSSYMMSKLWFLFALAIFYAACFTLIRSIAFKMPGGAEELFLFYITEFLVIVAGMMMGLFASALAPNANSAALLVIMFIIPQMVLSGAMVPLPQVVTMPASSRWAFQGFMAISGAGSDVARDACWNLSKEEQDKLTIDYKNKSCACMGTSALHETSCNFPGLGEYFRPAIDQKNPILPANPGTQPVEPAMPPEPVRSANTDIQVYLHELTIYNQKATALREQYKKELEVWQKSQEGYKAQMETYNQQLTTLEVERAIAIGSAESTIRRYKDDFGWTFIDKSDRKQYFKTLFIAWGAQIIIIIVLFIGTVLIQKKREVI